MMQPMLATEPSQGGDDLFVANTRPAQLVGEVGPSGGGVPGPETGVIGQVGVPGPAVVVSRWSVSVDE
jgi:hypothetical protein